MKRQNYGEIKLRIHSPQDLTDAINILNQLFENAGGVLKFLDNGKHLTIITSGDDEGNTSRCEFSQWTLTDNKLSLQSLGTTNSVIDSESVTSLQCRIELDSDGKVVDITVPSATVEYTLSE